MTAAMCLTHIISLTVCNLKALYDSINPLINITFCILGPRFLDISSFDKSVRHRIISC